MFSQIVYWPPSFFQIVCKQHILIMHSVHGARGKNLTFSTKNSFLLSHTLIISAAGWKYSDQEINFRPLLTHIDTVQIE